MERKFRLLLLCLFAAEQIVLPTAVNGDTDTDSGSSFYFYQDQKHPRDCKEVQDQCSSQNTNEAHLIRPDGYHEPFWVSCSGEWTIFQRRLDGFLDFNRNWTEYRDGFGYLNFEHWLGNEKLSQLTNQKDYELLIEIETASGVKANISYGPFRINDEFSDYTLGSLGQRSGEMEPVIMGCPSGEDDGVPYTPGINRDCSDVWRSGDTASGNYDITPSGWSGAAFAVNCNMTIDGGKWTVIQRRHHSSNRLDFNKDWESYKEGFGDPSGEFWIGNDKLFHLTNQREYELRIDMVQVNSHRQFEAKYDFFRINAESDKYRMIGLGNFTGNTDFDSMSYHRNMPFSTDDQDNDLRSDYDCATLVRGGWWYYGCANANFNRGHSSNVIGYWANLPGDDYLVYSEMKIRPKEASN